MREFDIITKEVNTAGPVQSEGANAIIFTNLSDAEVTVDNVPIPAYSSGMMAYPTLVYYGLEGEKMEHSFAIKFGSATTKRILVTRKKYQ